MGYPLGYIRDSKALCVYCNKRRGKTWDHVIPCSEGGQSVRSNLVQACRFCNSMKGSMSAELFHERIKDREYIKTMIKKTRRKITEKTEFLKYLKEIIDEL